MIFSFAQARVMTKVLPRALAVLLAAYASCFAPPTCAQTFPSKSIRLVAPFPAGGPIDGIARLIAPRFSELLGQQVVIDNRAGGGTVIGTEIVVRAPPDGHTCLIITSAVAINPSVIPRMPYDAQRDLAAVTKISSSPFILITHPAVPVRNTGELIKLARARPGELMFASSGIGGASHLSGMQFNLAAGINTVHVPYKGTAPLLTDLVAGQTQFNFSNPLGSMPLVRAGKLKVLGVGAKDRLEIAPEVPTISESGLPGFETGVWFAFFTTGGTPRETVQRLHTEMSRTLAAPDVRQKFTAGGAVIGVTTPEEMTAYLRSETAKWAKVVKASGVTPE
jgi:tripartite-type tricarboxylate transporter receptor subunit TctC